jgi:chromosome segregation ATPase
VKEEEEEMPPTPRTRSPDMSSSVGSVDRLDLVEILHSKSQGDSIDFLHCLIEDLRHEVEFLRTQLDESDQECAMLKTEMKNAEVEDRQRIDRLVQSLTQITKTKVAFTQEQMESFSPEEASNLTIATLTRNIEELSVKNTELSEEKIGLAERVHDLESENEAKHIKIGALEIQFKAINKTRQRAVHRLTNKDHSEGSH